MSPRQLRALRGSAVAFAATLIAAVAHTVGGAGAPTPLFILAVAVLTSPVAVALIGRRLSAIRSVLSVFLSQAFFHTAFAVAGNVAPVSSQATVGHAHDMTAMLGVGVAGASAGIVVDVGMLASHVVAAIITAAIVLRAERVVRAIARGLRAFARRIVMIRMPRPAMPVPPVIARVIAALRLTYTSDLSRRGPPVRAAHA